MILRIGNNSRLSVIGYRLSQKHQTSRTEHRTSNTERAFTLVELMISVVILGFGLCVIIRSYISTLSGFNITQNYITAMRAARDKEVELEIASFEDKGLLPDTKSGEITSGTRNFNWRTEVSEFAAEGNFSKSFVMASVNLNWQERNIPKSCAVITYLPKREELDGENGK